MDADKPIIVIKKKGGHGGHHGGAWKVAYADFVTAMMAFFMVMWLVNSASTPTKQRIASYFRRPGLFQEGSGTPLQIGGSGILDDAYVASYPEERQNEVGESQVPRRKGFDDGPFPASPDALGQPENKVQPGPDIKKKRATPSPGETPQPGSGVGMGEGEGPKLPEEGYIVESLIPQGEGTGPGEEPAAPAPAGEAGGQTAAEVAAEIKDKIESTPELQALLGAVDVKADADSINIEIMDTEKISMFASGSAYVRDEAREAFKQLALALAPVRTRIEIIGHTDAHPFSTRDRGYGNWELSVDRANAARRLLIQSGVDPARVQGIQGRADTQPRIPADPFAAANRRITIRMKFDPTVVTGTPVPPPGDTDKKTAAPPKATGVATAPVHEAPSDGSQPLERVHALTAEQVVEQTKAAKKESKRTAPPSTIGSPGEWKDPAFFGDK